MAHILAIDDDSAICATVCLILERAGHHVVTAQDGRGGLKLLEADRFDLLLIDIFMPEMDGLETIRMVRRSRPELPIIVMSGSVERAKMPDYLSFATKLGAIESLRLYLGTVLDVSEDPTANYLTRDDPDAPAMALYGYLSWLQEQAIEALSGEL